jgi:pilus assembly protein CpaE
LRERFQYVVVDCSSHMGEVTLEALESADRILVLTDLLLPGVKEAKLALQILQTLDIPSERVLLVLNRSDAHADFNAQSLEATLKTPIAVQIPSDGRLAVSSVHRGVPLVVTNPEAEMSQRVRELAGQVAPGVDASPAARQGKRRPFWAKAVGA